MRLIIYIALILGVVFFGCLINFEIISVGTAATGYLAGFSIIALEEICYTIKNRR